jgi:hypothetical protein
MANCMTLGLVPRDVLCYDDTTKAECSTASALHPHPFTSSALTVEEDSLC